MVVPSNLAPSSPRHGSATFPTDSSTPTPPSLTSESSPESCQENEDLDLQPPATSALPSRQPSSSSADILLPDWTSFATLPSTINSSMDDQYIGSDRFGHLTPRLSEYPNSPKAQPGSSRDPPWLDSDLPPHSWLHDEPLMHQGYASSSSRSFYSMEQENGDTCGPPQALTDIPSTESLLSSITPSMIAPSDTSLPFSPSMMAQVPTSDESLSLSSVRVIRPPRNHLPPQMRIIINGVPAQGAKSRVETQIRMRMELVAPAPTSDPGAPVEWERIGSFDYIKVPPLSGTKRKSKKYQNLNVPAESTLVLEAEVINATPPHARVFVCNSCRERERKRADRKKTKQSAVNAVPTAEEMRALNIDPNDPSAMEVAATRLQEEERKHAVLFNCGDYISFHDGEVVLSTRITCYCRHHREKVGFHIVFTLRNSEGDFVAAGSTPPIMIMDDHKSTAQYANPTRTADSRYKQTGSEEPSVSPRSVEGTYRTRERPKPYDDLISARRRTRPFHDVSQSPMDRSRNSFVLKGTQPVPGLDSTPSPQGVDGVSTPSLSQSPLTAVPDPSSLASANMGQLFMPLTVPSGMLGQASDGSGATAPSITKLVPAEGPTTGGIEVTVLGENFTEGIQCVFGDTPSTHTRVWSSTTLVCILPPCFRPGPVIVSLQGTPDTHSASQESQSLQLFTYIDSTDRALMELALQVVGLQMTGQMASARDIAMRIVAASQGPDQSTSSNSTSMQSTLAPDSKELLSMGLRLYSSNASKLPSIQDSLLGFLTLLDVDMERSTQSNALFACNPRGHTLLHLAVMHNLHRLVADLLRRGCPVNARDINGYTALHFAALHGWVMVTKLLLQHGADPFETNAEGLIPVELARRSEKIDAEHVLTDWVGDAPASDCGDETSDEGDDDDDDSMHDSSSEGDADITFKELAELAKAKADKKEVLSTPKASSWSLSNLLSHYRSTESGSPLSDTKSPGLVHSPPPTYDEATLDEAGDLNYIDGEKLLTDSGIADLHRKRVTVVQPKAQSTRRERRANRRAKYRMGSERAEASKKTIVRPRQGLYDDPMLLWFWIPSMLFVVLFSVAIQFGIVPPFQYEGSFIQRFIELVAHR
ncbi:unnamed protein product [Malassezia sympodialis ATCC 42132]|uniref:Similar to S.cerevisiae protein MGA2 (ER membrane protein involved in regulation of OLE1 transcription) n=1 Tax=Malassezia sympodialis (strain ATCC 42132) TaxID=1230383 RepID=M5E915_MALS4|nr:uncharacterized protein MSY001_1843 [Malassezia sympodialis ATCC 42132]CCU99137.1 unnamed protein product [Malassezia sympodialis ATCC 42132]SHO78375.1 Similar to S.cerevisiae protein MGA2 (ER membrane protein involved in regulation of OLE1 transcription) [Malassezia sympodialis ATCC 42132]|eukprot:XP_018740402.1 uncharacterized protein MSY001_1843 [Malassezia sympodialis ATCC 42132]